MQVNRDTYEIISSKNKKYNRTVENLIFVSVIRGLGNA